MKLHISIVTPTKTILETDADEIVIPTTEGEIAVLPHHIPLVTHIASGELLIKHGDKTDSFAVTGGFAEIGNNTVSILADYAVHAKDINERKAEEAKERAKHLMEQKLSEKDFAEAQAELERAMAQIRLIQKLRK